MGKEQVRIQMLGTSFTIQTDEDSVYLSRILDYVHDRITEVEGSMAVKDPLKVAILTAILITDDLFRQKAPSGQDEEEIKRITRSIMDRIENSLQ
ncbi:MAG: cell division protein ZapA [Spirochaetales bacterium]|jgi:cell division protein ZapA (FtsZ GTPase activity inhibitor)|nr:cell division protein ZapA [Spirochaetales bacterium]